MPSSLLKKVQLISLSTFLICIFVFGIGSILAVWNILPFSSETIPAIIITDIIIGILALIICITVSLLREESDEQNQKNAKGKPLIG